jgi:capsular exopolysaccharide synthesis family protein
VTASAILPETPIFPELRTSLVVGGILGFGVGVAFALMRTASDRRIRAADDVESRTGLPVIGTIPLTDSAGDSRLFDATSMTDSGARFAVTEALRSLRTNLQFMDVDNPPRTIVVTSPVPSDGKSTIACNLAITLAAGGKPVVLVDGDLRRSTVANTMGLPGGAGLSDVLSGRAEITDVLQRAPRFDNLFVLTAGSTPPNPSEVLGSERMHRLIEDLARHATVIIDAPPLLPVTDGAVLAHQADGAILVISLGKTTYDLLEKSIDTLSKAGGRALGVVLNKAPIKGIDASAYAYDYRREYGAASRAAAEPAPLEDDGFNLDGVFGQPPVAEAAQSKEKVTSERFRRG